jgi:N-acetylglucosaminyl-diphospho-decaprenol L-rhamnosyltransferase
MGDPTLSVVIVSWNVRELLRACLASLPSHAEVIVVDNASADGSPEMVAAVFPRVRLITNAENLGFTRGNNQGLAGATGDYVLFLNPDTLVAPGAISSLIAYAELHPRIGVLGPQLRYGDGSLQSSRRRFPTLATALFESTPVEWHWRNNPWARRYHMADRPTGPAQDVDWLVGAALLCRKEALDQVGGFDERFFMYSEELDLCRRMKAAAWRVVYLPDATITHYEGKSSEQAVAARHIRFHTSRVRYFRKHEGRAAAETVRLAILAMFAVEWCIEAGKGLLGSRRSLRRSRTSAYAQLLRSGLR